MKMHLNETYKKKFVTILTIAIIIAVIFVANKCYENYLLLQKKLDLPNIESVYEMSLRDLAFTSRTWKLTDQDRIARIMESLSCAKATNKTYEEIAASLEYDVFIYYVDENGEKTFTYYEVYKYKKSYYIISPLLYQEVWQIDEELDKLLLDTVIDIQSGKIS